MTQNNQPDWNKMAEKFDLWVPFIEPVAEKMLAIADVSSGTRVLDVASGTGEPAITLAKKMQGSAEITGTDAMEGMVKVAQNKVATGGLSGIEFKTMPAEKLEFEDNSFDQIICRFGVMLFQDSQQGLNEMFRVLKPDGKFVLAVWNTAETMPIMNWGYLAFKDKIEKEKLPAIEKLTSLGGAGVLDAMLEKAGFSQFQISTEDLEYQFDSFEQYWELVEASDVLKMQFDALEEGQKAQVKNEMAEFAKSCETSGGQLSVPHQYLLVSGHK